MSTMSTIAPLLAELQRRGWFPLWPAVLLGTAALAVVVVLYIREAGRLSVAVRALLAAVRAAVVIGVAFLLLRPVWVDETREVRRRPVAVLIDVSQSMDQADPRPDTADQWRAALAYGLIDADKGLPVETPTTTLSGRLPERPKRIEVARQALLNPQLGLLPGLSRVGPLEVSTFGVRRTARPLPAEDWLAGLTADEPRTALVESVFELLGRDDTEAPAAIVLVTDGRDNVGPRGLDDLARECARRQIPIYAYAVGSSAFGQLQVAFGSGAAAAPGAPADKARAGSDVDVPNTLFVDDLAAIPIRYTVKGLTEGQARLVLRYGDREVAARTERFTLTPEEARAGKTFASVLRFVPTKADADSRRQEYSVTVTVTAGDGPATDTLTSTVTRPAQVVNRKLKLLWVESVPRRDFLFMMRDLLRDRRVEARFYLTDGDKQAMRSGPPWMVELSREVNGVLGLDREEFRKLLFDFDLLILGAVPGKYFTREHQEVIREFVAEGGGLIHIAGRSYAPAPAPGEPDERRAPACWANARPPARGESNPLGELLPVEFEDVRMPLEPLNLPTGYVPVLAPAAARNAITVLEDDPLDNAALWGRPGRPPASSDGRQLKPMYWFYPVLRAKPATDVLLVHPTARTPPPDDKPMPLLVGHHYGKGYVLFCGFDDTWRWRFNTQSKYMGRFYTQAIYTAGIPRVVGTRRTQIAASTPAPVLGSTGEVYVRVFDENYRPLTADEIEATLEKLDADPNDRDRSVPVTLRRVPDAEGEYVATLAYNRVGRYRLTVDPRNNSPATLHYQVSYPDNHELAPAPPDEPGLRRLCEATGGRFYREEDLFRLPGDVLPQTTILTTRREVLLWNEWALALIVGLLTLEWFVRKFNGLS